MALLLNHLEKPRCGFTTCYSVLFYLYTFTLVTLNGLIILLLFNFNFFYCGIPK